MNTFSQNIIVNNLIVDIRKRYPLTRVVSDSDVGKIIDLTSRLTAEYDESHDIYHHINVYHNSFIILDSMKDTLGGVTNEIAMIVTYASLLHDTIDYKYNNTREKTALLEAFLAEQLNTLTATTVMWIIDNISFSKEKAHGYLEQKVFEIKTARDIVSDADKIEALGEIGLARCFAYTRSKNPTSSDAEITCLVKQHCHDKLLILHQYCNTQVGKEMALKSLEHIEAFVSK